MVRRVPLAAAFAALLALAGCGLGPGPTPTGVRLEVTSEFGANTLLSASAPRAHGQETVMSLLMRNSKVATRYGGGFVEAIDGLSGGHEGPDPVDWFYYLNGVEASKGAAEADVHPGERIWWDRHDWSQAQETPAVVGSFPEPFLSGIEGERFPVRVECVQIAGSACQAVLKNLRGSGVPAAVAAPTGAPSPKVLRVLVGQFSQIGGDPAVRLLQQGPRASGVYVRVAHNWRTMSLLDEHGAARATAAAGSGLVAATRNGSDAPVWIVAGTDAAGTLRAAQALDESDLHDRFALAIGPAGAVGLPFQRP